MLTNTMALLFEDIQFSTNLPIYIHFPILERPQLEFAIIWNLEVTSLYVFRSFAA